MCRTSAPGQICITKEWVKAALQTLKPVLDGFANGVDIFGLATDDN
jgi:hypothetical protein